MPSRKIPTRKHRGVKDPVKQAAVRFESIKNKVNNPPTEIDTQPVPRRVVELKNAMERLKNQEPKKRNKRKNDNQLIDTTIFQKKPFKLPGMNRREKPVPIFKQLPGENSRNFLHRITLKCQEVIHESQFEDKFNVEVQRNATTGHIESVDKLSKEDTKFMRDLTPHNKSKKEKPKSAEKKKQRLAKLKEKKLAKKKGKVDEFAHYRDVVKFGEVAHEPPKLTTLPRKSASSDMPGKRDLLLKGMLPTKKDNTEKNKASVFKKNVKSKGGKVAKKKNDKSPAEKMRLEAQRVAAVQAYRDLKARKKIAS